jgi:hypothetical protein
MAGERAGIAVATVIAESKVAGGSAGNANVALFARLEINAERTSGIARNFSEIARATRSVSSSPEPGGSSTAAAPGLRRRDKARAQSRVDHSRRGEDQRASG